MDVSAEVTISQPSVLLRGHSRVMDRADDELQEFPSSSPCTAGQLSAQFKRVCGLLVDIKLAQGRIYKYPLLQGSPLSRQGNTSQHETTQTLPNTRSRGVTISKHITSNCSRSWARLVMGKGLMTEGIFHLKDGKDLIGTLLCKHGFFSFSLCMDYL